MTIDLSAFGELTKDFNRLSKSGVPFATRNALNRTAFASRKAWVEEVSGSMTLRNTYTTRSLRVDKASGYDVRTMRAVLGSVAPYMAIQEDGATESRRGKHGVAIPTPSSAGHSLTATKRTRLVRRANWMTAMQIAANRVTGSRQRRNAVAIVLASKGSGVAFLDLGRRKGIFRVMPGSLKRSGRTIRMIWDLSRPSIAIPRNPTLQDSLRRVAPLVTSISLAAIKEQVEGHVVRRSRRR